MSQPEKSGNWRLIVGENVFELEGHRRLVDVGEYAIMTNVENEMSNIRLCEVKEAGSLEKACLIFRKVQTDDCDSCGAKGYQVCAMDCPNRK